MLRPPVNVVVPFLGAADELTRLLGSLERLRLQDGDTVVVVDNGPRPAPVRPRGRMSVIHAGAISSPGFARNQGAAAGRADWIVFIDADTVPGPDLLDDYWEPPPGERTALMAGGVLDEPVPRRAGVVARYAHLRGLTSQDNTFCFGEWSFAQTSNAACRRAAFEAVGGFREHIRAGEDADLTYRLRLAGWEVERRERASVVHRSRQTARGLVAQKLGHGAGAAWLARQYPGSFPARRRPGLAWWAVRRATSGLLAGVRDRDRDVAVRAAFDALEHMSYELGRSLSNEVGSRRDARRRG